MIRINNGRILDPGSGRDETADLLIDGGSVVKIGRNVREAADFTIDAKGLWVMPGFVDLHVHLREPGFTAKEDIASGTRAAAAGGFTTVCAMPNTSPAIDTPERVKDLLKRIGETAAVRVKVIGAVTIGQEGRELCDLTGMAKAGAAAFSEDGKSVADPVLMRQAMEIMAREDLLLLDHCEDKALAGSGVMHEGARSKELGLPGIPSSAENVMAAREILLAGETGARIHLCHCSTKESAALIDWAWQQGWRVSGETCPHYFTLCDEDIPEDDANFKMNPPLRAADDREAIRNALGEGVLQVIATDHAPHTPEEKRASMREAPFGIVGLETAAALTYTELVEKDILTPLEMAAKMSFNPAMILGIDAGTLRAGGPADVVLFDPDAEYEIDPETFASRGRNTPFAGMTVRGRVMATICGGSQVYEDKRLKARKEVK